LQRRLSSSTIPPFRRAIRSRLNFVSSEIHKQFGPLFNPKITAEWKANQLDLLGQRFDYLTERLNGKPYLMGDQLTVADAYFFTVLNWSNL
jgi:glutathione S-transferase